MWAAMGLFVKRTEVALDSTGDGVWDFYARIKAVAQSLGCFRLVRIASGATRDTPVTQRPALTIVDKAPSEDKESSDTGLRRTLEFEIIIEVDDASEELRVREINGRTKSLLNALDDDSVIAGYFPQWGKAENEVLEGPFERRIIPGTATIWSTATGR